MKAIISKLLVILIIFVMFPTSSVSNAINVNIEPSNWAKESIDSLKSTSVLSGSELFSNYRDNITRQEFAYLSVKAYELLTGKVATLSSNAFKDTQNEWVLKAKALGIVGGYTDGTFRPNNFIRRDEIAVMLINILKSGNIDYLSKLENLTHSEFSDDEKIASWAKSKVYEARTLGLISGVGNNAFNPTGNASREQVMVIIESMRKIFPLKSSTNVFNFKLGDFVSFGKYDGVPIIWQIIDFDINGNPMLFSYHGLTVKPFDPPFSGNVGSAINYGSNIWSESTLRKWLNSEENSVTWGEKKPSIEAFNDAIRSYENEPGFLSGLNFAVTERDAILTVKNKTIASKTTSNVSEGGNQLHILDDDHSSLTQNYDNAFYTTSLDRVFLLSTKDISELVYNKVMNKSNLTEKAKLLFSGGAKGFWLRDPEVNSDHVVRMIYDASSSTLEGAITGGVAVRPALYLDINKIGVLSGTGTKESAYVISIK